MHPNSYKLFAGALIIIFVLSACNTQPTTAPVAQTNTPQASTPLPGLNTPIPATATATLPPQPAQPASRTLVICLGQEPSSLYLYGASSVGMWSVLEAIYDGPIDTRQYSAQPVILQKLPSFNDKDAAYEPVDVKAGDLVVNADGNLVNLSAGTRVLPSGCSGAGCAQTWDGKKALKLDRLKVTFKLLPVLKWSDGEALTAADSVYSFTLASDPATRVTKQVTDRTLSYVATDDTTIEWTGRPGYAPQDLNALFFQPLPQHAWGKIKPAEMENNDAVGRKPMGWGPYVIQDWKAGSNIRLTKNPNYFRANEGLPHFDNLVFRFLGEPGDNNLTAVQVGECDVVDRTTLVGDQLPQIIQLENSKKIKAVIGQGPDWEQLSFGIKPSSYDDGYNPSKDRPDFFGDVRVRQAFAYCIDRQAIVKNLLSDRSSVLASYLPPGHPLLPSGLVPLPYDAAKGSQLLTDAGWKDQDNNPATPRTAQGAANVPVGTAFSITYATTEATLRKQTADLVVKNLGDCGIQVKVVTQSPGQLYAPGPDGVLFGRSFDLAEFSWQAGSQPPCSLFTSASIPSAKNSWTGGNLTGYSSPAFDAACLKATEARPDSPDRNQAYQDTVNLVAKDLPVIPLYAPIQVAISRPDFCGLSMDVTARSLLWNIEAFDYNSSCK
jgi:peptide/nickel transport system substrate-binding protein